MLCLQKLQIDFWRQVLNLEICMECMIVICYKLYIALGEAAEVELVCNLKPLQRSTAVALVHKTYIF